MKLLKRNSIFARTRSMSKKDFKSRAKLYFDTKTNTLITIDDISFTDKSAFCYILINNEFEIKLRLDFKDINNFHQQWDDPLPPIYSSIDNFVADVHEKIASSTKSYKAALKTIENYKVQQTKVNTILQDYPEYFI